MVFPVVLLWTDLTKNKARQKRDFCKLYTVIPTRYRLFIGKSLISGGIPFALLSGDQ
jgi:hypothetical protein